MAASLFSVSAVCAIVIALWFALRTTRRPVGLPYPPGPKRLPIAGNAFDINFKEPYLTYTEWGKIYGDLVYSRIFGQDFLIVNSENTARLLADQRSSIYSDRPHSPIYRLLRNDVVDRYQDMHLRSAHRLLENVRRDSKNFYEHFDLYTGGLALEFTYGRRIEGKDDPIISLANRLADVMSKGITGERIGLLTALPMLTCVPLWFPGAKFQHEARHCRNLVAAFSELPFAAAKKQAETSGLQPSFVSDILTQGGEDESAAKVTATGVYLAAAESSSATLKILVLAMILNPGVQDMVHAELDAVVGGGALPTFEDRERLPYLQAILYEVMRWRPAFPLGVPHFTTTSDVFEGYYIPKGAGMSNREYSDPERFDPTRHLDADGKLKPEAKQNSSKYFGFGRRACPGRFFADDALWAATAVILSAFRFEKAKDSLGNDIEVVPVFRPGVIRRVADHAARRGHTSTDHSLVQSPRSISMFHC
ncbi:cytochrome P450 [Pisolithus orientalis]|uniref:cytochrome P450 n=1 Tax=Pisolithus orientalis TaxID=936130 RepID=UPI0022243251|nr:cytochrome P450 [Pisolithus orientalis]KAI6006540.1 cytochrome P450 [Pisolithus orientalis]